MTTRKIAAAAALAFGLVLQTEMAHANLMNITTGDMPWYISSGDGPIASKAGSQGDQALYEWLDVQYHNYLAVVDPDPVWGEPQPIIKASGTSLDGVDWEGLGLVGHYLVVHWGTGQAGKLFGKADKPDGGFNQAFYINSAADNSLAIPTLLNELTGIGSEVGGLSFWRVYDPPVPPPSVPETTSTLCLFGFALGMLSVIHRQRPSLVPVRKLSRHEMRP